MPLHPGISKRGRSRRTVHYLNDTVLDTPGQVAIRGPIGWLVGSRILRDERAETIDRWSIRRGFELTLPKLALVLAPKEAEAIWPPID